MLAKSDKKFVWTTLFASAAMVALRVMDIDPEAGTLRIPGTGKNKTSELSLHASQVLLFYQYIQIPDRNCSAVE